MSQQLQEQILDGLRDLPDDQQRRVLEFVRTLATTRLQGVAGKELLRFAGTIPAEDVYLMAKAIEEGCEQVDADGW